MRRAVLAAAVAALLLAPPATAAAHTQLERTKPAAGSVLERQPRAVELFFSEPVEAAFGAVRVYGAARERVDDGGALRSGEDPTRIGIGLRPDLPDGSYTVTYRVVSADSHVISGGFVFSIATPGAPPAAPAAPQATVAELIEAGGGGPVSDLAAGLFRVLLYAALALAVGGLVFLVAVWRPATAATRAPGSRSAGPADEVSAAAVLTRLRVAFLAAAALGAIGAAGGIVMQGAEAAGVSGFEALRSSILSEALDTRFGTYRGLAVLAWLIFAALAALLLRPTPSPMGRFPAYMSGNRPIGSAVALAAPLAFLVCVPALSGHASVQSPVAVLFPANVVHVTAMATWLGGLAALLYAVPAAVRRFVEPDPGDSDPTDTGSSRLLAALLPRFSRLALVAVALLALTGLVQAYVLVRDPADLLDTAYGRAVLAKFLLLSVVVAIAAHMRRRGLLPRGLRAEVGLLVVVLGVTAALASYQPPISVQAGPYSASATTGDLVVELTVDPARPGRNDIHLYLFDARTGAQFTAAKEVALTATLPAEEIGPLEPDLRPAGPGHYIAPGASLGVGGEWELDVTARVSAFDQYEAEFQVPVE